MQYRVRIGKTNRPGVYIKTPNDHIIAYHKRAPSRDQAKQLAHRVRQRLRSGTRLQREYWTPIR